MSKISGIHFKEEIELSIHIFYNFAHWSAMKTISYPCRESISWQNLGSQSGCLFLFGDKLYTVAAKIDVTLQKRRCQSSECLSG